MGLAREAFFYNLLASKLKGANVPACYYAEGSLETGEMLLLLECCTNAVPSGVFFGQFTPMTHRLRFSLPRGHCWGAADFITESAAPHSALSGSVGSCLIYADVRAFR